MKKIILLSDTHGYVDSKILKYVEEADEVWHAGDIGSFEVINKLSSIKPVKAVYGNIDNQELRKEFKKNMIFSVQGVKVLMTHIGGYPNNYNPRVFKLLNLEKPNLLICGHSHILKVIKDEKFDLLHLNPGACGIFGFHRLRTMIRFSLNLGRIINLEIIELGLRGKLTQPIN